MPNAPAATTSAVIRALARPCCVGIRVTMDRLPRDAAAVVAVARPLHRRVPAAAIFGARRAPVPVLALEAASAIIVIVCAGAPHCLFRADEHLLEAARPHRPVVVARRRAGLGAHLHVGLLLVARLARLSAVVVRAHPLLVTAVPASAAVAVARRGRLLADVAAARAAVSGSVNESATELAKETANANESAIATGVGATVTATVVAAAAAVAAAVMVVDRAAAVLPADAAPLPRPSAPAAA
jgi:hypothetical protein